MSANVEIVIQITLVPDTDVITGDAETVVDECFQVTNVDVDSVMCAAEEALKAAVMTCYDRALASRQRLEETEAAPVELSPSAPGASAEPEDPSPSGSATFDPNDLPLEIDR